MHISCKGGARHCSSWGGAVKSCKRQVHTSTMTTNLQLLKLLRVFSCTSITQTDNYLYPGKKAQRILIFPREKPQKHPEQSLPPTLGWIFHFNQHQAGHAQGWGAAAYRVGNSAVWRVQILLAGTPLVGMGVLLLPQLLSCQDCSHPSWQLHLKKEDWHQEGISGNEEINFPNTLLLMVLQAASVTTVADFSYSMAGVLFQSSY